MIPIGLRDGGNTGQLPEVTLPFCDHCFLPCGVTVTRHMLRCVGALAPLLVSATERRCQVVSVSVVELGGFWCRLIRHSRSNLKLQSVSSVRVIAILSYGRF